MQPAPRLPITANRSLLQRYLLALLVVGLLWLPLAGRLHQVVHFEVGAHLAAPSAHFPVETLFEHHSPHQSQNGSLDCQVFDAHCFGLALSKAIPALPVHALALGVDPRTSTPIVWRNTRLIPEARAGPAFI